MKMRALSRHTVHSHHRNPSDRPPAPDGDLRGAVVVEIPGMHLVTGGNQRLHWGARAAQVSRERQSVRLRMLCSRASLAAMGPGVVLTVTRVAPRPVDTTNLGDACKAVVDEACESLEEWWTGKRPAPGRADGSSERIEIRLRQAKGPYAVRLTITKGVEGAE